MVMKLMVKMIMMIITMTLLMVILMTVSFDDGHCAPIIVQTHSSVLMLLEVCGKCFNVQ